MKRFYSLTLAGLLLCTGVYSQTDPDTSWKSGGLIGLTFSQVNLSQWALGGDNSMAFTTNANVFANYVTDKIDWQNNLILAYGTVKTGTAKSQKSDDKIDLTSQYARRFSKNWLYGALFNFKSQFTSGYNYPDDSSIVSKFMSPGYFTIGVGVTYKPVEYFDVYLSPASVKLTFVNDQTLSDVGAYGVDPGENLRTEVGAYMNMKFKKDIMTNVNLFTKLELFSNYQDKPANVDVNWENILTLTVNKYINASVTAQVIYDADVVERTQFKETIGVGFAYKFGVN